MLIFNLNHGGAEEILYAYPGGAQEILYILTPDHKDQLYWYTYHLYIDHLYKTRSIPTTSIFY